MIQILEQNNYQVAINLAVEKLKKLNPERQANKCGCRWLKDEKKFILKYLDLTCSVSFPDGVVRDRKDEKNELPLWEQILILHYLTSTNPIQNEGEPIVFSQVPQGAFYETAFNRRVKNHFLSVFSRKPQLLIPSAQMLGGRKYESQSADIAVVIPAFDKINLYFLLWLEDEEFPADMNFLMSSNISCFFSTEDIAVLGGIAAGKLIKASRQLIEK